MFIVPVLVPGSCILLFALLVFYWGHRLAALEEALDDPARWDTVTGAVTTERATEQESDPGYNPGAAGWETVQVPLRPMALDGFEPPGLAMAREHFVQVQEQERRLLAAELHDDIGQQLCGLKLQLHRLARLTPPDGEAQQLSNELNGVVDELVRSVRRLSLGLHPQQLERLGMVAAMRAHLDRLCVDGHLDGRLDASGELGNLSPAKAATLFRFFQEALGNVLRHAQASHVDIRLRGHAAEVWLEIEDDGIGFDVDRVARRTSSLGLTTMRERVAALGGRLQIHSLPGSGTRLSVRVPRLKWRRAGDSRSTG